MHDKVRTVLTVLLFILIFSTLGWLAPVMYASYAPSDHFVEKNAFEAPDISGEANVHNVCFNRTVHRGAAGSVITELYIVPENSGESIEVLSRDNEQYFQRGTYSITFNVQLPDELPEGEYRYRRVYTMSLAGGRLERTFVFESEMFNVTSEQHTTQHNISC